MSNHFGEPFTVAGRRAFLSQAASGIGTVALASLLARESEAAPKANAPGIDGLPNLPVKAKRVIYLFQSGAPSQIDLFDEKPALANLRATELPDSIRKGQRLTGMTSKQESFPVAPSMFKFKRHGESGANLSELLPHTAKIADDICIVRSMFTEAINHDPAITYLSTIGCGVVGFYRRSTRVSGFDRLVIPFCFCQIRRVLTVALAGRCWTILRN